MTQNTNDRERPDTWRSATVLVAEDDEMCRQIVTRALLSRGYRVLSAEHGHAALTIAQVFAGPIDVLVTDFFMPDLNGRELAERLQKMRPDIKVLFMTGYMNRLLHVMSSLEGWSEDILSKPIAPETLDEVIQAALLNKKKAGGGV